MRPKGNPKMSVTTNLHCITSQKSKDLIYTASETWNHSTSTWNYVDFRLYYFNFIIMMYTMECMAYNWYLCSLMVSTWRRPVGSEHAGDITKQNKIKSYLIMHTRISVVTYVTCYRIQTGICTDLMTANLHNAKLYPSLVSSTAPALFQFPSSGQLPTTNTDSCRRVSALAQNFQSRCSSLIVWMVCLASTGHTVTITYEVNAGFNNCLISLPKWDPFLFTNHKLNITFTLV